MADWSGMESLSGGVSGLQIVGDCNERRTEKHAQQRRDLPEKTRGGPIGPPPEGGSWRGSQLIWAAVSLRRVSSGSLWKRHERIGWLSKRSKTYHANWSSWTKGTSAWPEAASRSWMSRESSSSRASAYSSSPRSRSRLAS